MSIAAKLYIEDKEHNLLFLRISAKKEVDGHGYPLTGFIGGFFDIEIESTKDTTILQWAIDHDTKKDVKIVISSRFGTGSSRIIELKDVYCLALNESFINTTPKPMAMSFKLSPGGMYQNGQQLYVKHWHTPAPKPIKHQADDEKDKEKRVTIHFTADKNEADEGKFGYDNFDDYDSKCTSGIEKLKKEYKPIQVFGKEYTPVWVSMRKGQTITLQLKISKDKNYKLFNEIKFAGHPDFTFAPANLQGKKEVQITCNNNNAATAQIKVEADGETAGAINFFYPEPKKIDLRWIVVNFNEGDSDLIKKDINLAKLDDYFKKAFNPALIDINIVNANAEILDVTKTTTTVAETNLVARIKKHIEEGTKDESKSDEKERRALMIELHGFHKTRNEYRIDQNEITLLLTNLKCQLPVKGQEEPDSNNGISLKGISLLFFGNEKKYPKKEIPHEIMHAIGLKHSFKEGHDTPGSKKHTYRKTGTPNFMDYETSQNRTFYWQWEEIYNSSYSK